MASPAVPAPAPARGVVRSGRARGAPGGVPGAGTGAGITAKQAPMPALPVPVPGRWAGAGAACLTLGSLALHVVMLVSGGHGLFLGLVLAVMALACAGCAAHAVLRPGCRGALGLLGMSIGMALVHAVLVLGLPGGAGMQGMHDGGAGSMHADLMLAVVGVELAVAWLVGLSIHRVRAATRGRMPS